jgi:hypothetical protein
VRFAIMVFATGVDGAVLNVLPPSGVHCQLKKTLLPTSRAASTQRPTTTSRDLTQWW